MMDFVNTFANRLTRSQNVSILKGPMSDISASLTFDILYTRNLLSIRGSSQLSTPQTYFKTLPHRYPVSLTREMGWGILYSGVRLIIVRFNFWACLD